MGNGRRQYALAAIAVAATTLAMLVGREHLGVLNVLLIYLLLVFGVALTAGAGPSTAVAVVSFLLFDVLFIPPYHTFTIADADHVLTIFVYLAVAILTSQLVARVRARTEVALREQRRTALLYELNAALVGDVTLPEILNTIVERVVHVYGAAGARILIPQPDTGRLEVRAAYPPGLELPLDRQMAAVAEQALATGKPVGIGGSGRRIVPPASVRMPPAGSAGARPDLRYIPISAAGRRVGVLEVQGPHGTRTDAQDDGDVLTSFANQAALALERGRLTEISARAAALAQSDELKSALLAAVSHDLRTPLAVIKTATSSLLDPAVSWTETERTEFLHAIDEESDRLTLMVSNLLDLSRIEGGVLRPDREWYDVAELVEDVADRLRARAPDPDWRIETLIAGDLPLVYLDYVEIAQVLMNLGENALRYAADGGRMVLSATRVKESVELTVTDFGPGIPDSEQAHIFEKFYRMPGSARVPGSGIGLAISKGIVEAHGGSISVESAPGAGATFRVLLPIGPAGERAA